MLRTLLILLGFFIFFSPGLAQQAALPNVFVWESTIHAGYIVRNSGDLPKNRMPFFISLNPSVQTSGKNDWNQALGFPRVGCRITLGDLGNKRELGYMLGLTPNMTFKSLAARWYVPAVNLGLGIAWFNKPFNMKSNPGNFYIGSQITALAEASVQVEPKINNRTFSIIGIRVIHNSNGHYQVPNLGMNTLSLYMGILFNSKMLVKPEIRDLNVPKSKIHLNLRSGIGIHELARTFGPTGTPKYAIYVNDIYLSKLYGKVSNIHFGLEVNYYKSYYDFTVNHNLFTEDRKLKSTVFTAFLAHELMLKRVSLLTQGGINLYNKFYNAYINQYKSEQGMSLALKKMISTRLGIQYYLFDPQYCSRTNVFVGAYIKAHFGQADFVCFQVGLVL